MNFVEIFKTENEKYLDIYDAAIAKIEEIKGHNFTNGKLNDYFGKTTDFIAVVNEIVQAVKTGKMDEMAEEELKSLNSRLYNDIVKSNYDNSYANPEIAVSAFGEGLGRILSLVYVNVRKKIEDAFSYRLFNLVPAIELFNKVFDILAKDEKAVEEVKEFVNTTFYERLDDEYEVKLRTYFDEKMNYATSIVLDSDLDNLSYLYKYDSVITEREIKIAEYFKNMPEEKIQSMADTFTNGYIRGYKEGNLDINYKKFVAVMYPIGFEKMAKLAKANFDKVGLKTIYKIYQPYFTNRQYEYDHRQDYAMYLDEKYVDKALAVLDTNIDKNKEILKGYGSVAAIDIFGAENFEPKNKKEAITLSESQTKVDANWNRMFNIKATKAFENDKAAFTIIAYPTPEIGDKFEEIFNETVKINNLDNDLYTEIQQNIIDVLDKAEYVHVTGMGDNKTDLKVNLYKLNDPEKETKFENCVASVNIPVGEVFTSPVLKDTTGKLHVTSVFLNGLNYKNLEIDLVDGMIKDYTCDNFESEEENKKLIKEKILANNETVPIGEFAIGTNTTAYVMGKKYGIEDKLPILIAEKTGPHFAMGDTCFSMAEDNKTYNPNGKQIMAKDNECSILRKTDVTKAYFSCHTDITIPYDELGEISAINKDGSKTVIIEKGRFVLPGTEKLNEAFNE